MKRMFLWKVYLWRIRSGTRFYVTYYEQLFNNQRIWYWL